MQWSMTCCGRRRCGTGWRSSASRKSPALRTISRAGSQQMPRDGGRWWRSAARRVNEGRAEVVDVVIVGAGIGGLTAALALARVGIKVRVYESVEDLRPLGVGINLLPHATKVL